MIVMLGHVSIPNCRSCHVVLTVKINSHYAYCLAVAILTCFIINVMWTLLTMTVYLGPNFDKISLIIAGMPYVQRRSFNLRQQGGRSFSLEQQGGVTHSHMAILGT
jgi:hypothetical protein